MVENRTNGNTQYYFDLAYGKRPEFELYDIVGDPYCLTNLYGKEEYKLIGQELKGELMKELKKSKDPRVVGPDKEIFESYIRYSPIREFPEPNPKQVNY